MSDPVGAVRALVRAGAGPLAQYTSRMMKQVAPFLSQDMRIEIAVRLKAKKYRFPLKRYIIINIIKPSPHQRSLGRIKPYLNDQDEIHTPYEIIYIN